MTLRYYTLPVSLVLCWSMQPQAGAQPANSQAIGDRDLTSFSLEELMNVQVTSVSKKEQNWAKAGASVFVISQDDIRRSGAMNIPDLLRIVPGVNVAQVDANSWAISVRGFNSIYSNKVLVMIDGRSVYSDIFSGVYWDQQDVPLEDIDRIEVIRGPGGTVWGANAVNGIINIITRSSKDTHGGLVTVGSGMERTADSLVQYGGEAGRHGSYRVFGRYFNVDDSALGNGRDAADGWRGIHGGFRSDWDLSPRDSLTIQGDILQSHAGQTITTLLANQTFASATFNDRMNADTANILGRWNHTYTNGSETSLQLYYDQFAMINEGWSNMHRLDSTFEYHFHWRSRHDFVAGAGYRFTDSDSRAFYATAFVPAGRNDYLANAFLQDEIRLAPSISLTLGSKFEHNCYTGFEYEPSAQIVWSPGTHQTVWGSVGRAIRQPSWSEANVITDWTTFPGPGGALGVVKILGNPNFQAEKLLDYEAGYRTEISTRLSFDLTGFLSYYHDLRTTDLGSPYFVASTPVPYLAVPEIMENHAHGRNYGGEVSLNWNVTKRWRLSPGGSFLQTSAAPNAGYENVVSGWVGDGDSPKFEAQLRSFVNITRRLEWDTSMYFVGALKNGPVPSYTRLDTRIGWRAGEHWDFSVTGQNLLMPRHQEFADAYQVHPTYFERSVLGKITWHF